MAQESTERSQANVAAWIARHPFVLGAVSSGISIGATMAVMAARFPDFAGWPGSRGFVGIAANLAQDGIFASAGESSTTERMPLYPLLLAAVMRIVGADWRWWAVGLNALALVACGGLATQLCARFRAGAAATWACALVLAFHIAWSIEALAFRETVWFALALLGIATLLTTPQIGAVRLGLAGALAGAAYLLRPTGFLIVAVLPFWLWIVRRFLTHRWARATAIALSVAALPVIGWQVYTVHTVGHLQLSNGEGGNTALKGAIPEFWVVAPWVDLDLLDTRIVAEAARAGNDSPETRDRFWRKRAEAEVRAAPGDWLVKAGLKTAMMISPVSVPFGYGQLVPQGSSLRLVGFRWDPWAFASVPAVLLILGGMGWRWWRWPPTEKLERAFMLAVALLVAAIFVLHAATSGETRYRLPFDPLLAILAAPMIGRWWTVVTSRRRPATP